MFKSLLKLLKKQYKNIVSTIFTFIFLTSPLLQAAPAFAGAPVDIITPTITAPLTGPLSGTVAVTANITRNGAGQVDYWLGLSDQTTVFLEGFGSPTVFLNYSWDTTKLANGSYSIALYARKHTGDPKDNIFNDSTSTNSALPLTITNVGDTTKPEIPVISSPSEGTFFNSSPITVDWNDVYDASGVDHYNVEYEYDGGTTDSATSAVSQISFVPALQGGVKARAQAVDTVGNIGDWSSWVHFYYDINPGTTTISYPRDGQVTNNLNIQGSSGDNVAIASVELFYRVTGDLTWLPMATLTAPTFNDTYNWHYLWSPANGVYDIKASSVDKAGNVEGSAYVYGIVYDGTAPATPTHISPSDGAKIKPADAILTWSSETDPEGNGPVTYNYKSSWTGGNYGPVSTGTNNFINATGSADRDYLWQVQACDSLGNCSPWSTGWHVIIDGTKPVDPSAFTSNPVTGYTKDQTIEISWPAIGEVGGASDNLSGVAGFSYFFSNNEVDTPDTTQDISGTQNSITSETLSAGTWYFHIRTVDNAGNWTSTAHFGPFVIDITNPTLSIISPSNNAWVKNPVIYGLASDTETGIHEVNVAVRAYPSNAFLVNCPAVYNGVDSTWTLSFGSGCNIPDGRYNLVATAYDNAGNSTSLTRTGVRVDNTAPVISDLRLSADYNPWVNGNFVLLSGALSDNFSGINGSSCEVTNDGGLTWINGSYSMITRRCGYIFTSLSDGYSASFGMRVKDNVGNTVTSGFIGRTSDALGPSSSAVIDNSYYGPHSYSASEIKGVASDTVSNIEDVNIYIRRSSDNRYWNGGSFCLIFCFLPIPLNPVGTTNWNYTGLNPLMLSDGVRYTVTPWAKDSVDHMAFGTSDSFIWDASAPINPSPFTFSHTESVYSNDSTIDASWPAIGEVGGATDSLSGVKGYSYVFSTNPDETTGFTDIDSSTTSVTSSILSDGIWYFRFKTVDNVGNWSEPVTKGPFYIETVAPVTSDDSDSSWHNTDVTINFTCVDADSGCATTYSQVDGGGFVAGSSVTITTDGYHIVQYYSVDNAGNIEETKYAEYRVKVDKTAPINPSPFTTNPLVDTHASQNTIDVNWLVQAAATSLAFIPSGAEDNLSGVDGFSYVFNQTVDTDPDTVKDLEPETVNADSGIVLDGTWYFHLRTVDVAGNWSGSVHAGPFYLDTTKPVITRLGAATVTITKGDAYADAGATAMDNIEGDITAKIVTVNNVNTNTPGTYTVTYNVSDLAGNAADEVTRTVVVNAAPQPAVQGVQTEETKKNDKEEDNGEVLGLTCDKQQTLSGYVYKDANMDRTKEADEVGVKDVKVNIYYTNTAGEKILLTTVTTDENGFWSAKVCPTEYSLEIDESTIPQGYKIEGEPIRIAEVMANKDYESASFPIIGLTQDQGWPWWVWLLIIAGVAALAGTGYYIVKKRREEK